MTQVTKESLAQWIAELESQPHLSLKEERYLAVMQRCAELEAVAQEALSELVEIADVNNHTHKQVVLLNNSSVQVMGLLHEVLK